MERFQVRGKNSRSCEMQVTSTLIKNVRMVFFSNNKTLHHPVYTTCSVYAKIILLFILKPLHIILSAFVYLGQIHPSHYFICQFSADLFITTIKHVFLIYQFTIFFSSFSQSRPFYKFFWINLSRCFLGWNFEQLQTFHTYIV